MQVERTWPGDKKEAESLWLDASSGASGLSTFGTKLSREDRFTVPIVIEAGAPNQTVDEAEERGAVLLDAVDDLCATYPTLDDLDGVMTVRLGQVDGPETHRTQQGAVCLFRAEINVHTRST